MNDLESDIDLYDHERIKINAVASTLREAIGEHRNLEGFRREIMNRFAEIGLVTDVRVFTDESAAEPVYAFKVLITDRTEVTEDEFDHDRQGYEVRSNILNLDQKDSPNKTSVAMPGKLWTPGSD